MDPNNSDLYGSSSSSKTDTYSCEEKKEVQEEIIFSEKFFKIYEIKRQTTIEIEDLDKLCRIPALERYINANEIPNLKVNYMLVVKTYFNY